MTALDPGTGSERQGPRFLLDWLRAEPLVVLRAFLGVTFVIAGLQKLDNPNFFKAGAPGSFVAQTKAALTTSPVAPLLRVVLHAPTAIAFVIAIAELAVGFGTLLGLLGRVAATGGLLLSLSFFLSISYATTPYYYGSDVVFVFAWTALIFGGSGRLSLDAVAARRLREARASAPAAPAGTSLTRRALLERLTTLAAALGASAIVSTLVVEIARSDKDHSNGLATKRRLPPATEGPTSGRGATTAPKGQRIASVGDVPLGGATAFTDDAQSIPAYVLQPEKGSFIAFSRICTHAGCTVSFNRATEQFDCPCHGSIYDAKTGAVVRGPAPLPLPEIRLSITNGEIYASD